MPVPSEIIFDSHDAELNRNVHPDRWQNPTPRGRYHLVVIGAGTAGLVAAAGAAGLGAKVAIVERHRMGGDCLNTGCVPSKGIISAARIARAFRLGSTFGITTTGGYSVDFAAVMQRMRQLRASISVNDSADRFRSLGVDVYFGDASFLNSHEIEVAGQTLSFRRALLATGARAAVPPITGLSTVPYLTNETLFSLTERPGRLAVIGAGPIGCEMAQAFAELGSKVYLLDPAKAPLPREDADVREIVRQSLEDSGVQVWTGTHIESVSQEGSLELKIRQHDENRTLAVDRILVATGRLPNIEGLHLEKAGIASSPKGVVVDDYLRTTAPTIYASGDVCSPFQFTHAADFMSRMALQNALFFGRQRVSRMLIPWCTYTTPEVAHVGLNQRQLDEAGIKTTTFSQSMTENDRAILEGETLGLAKVHVRAGSDKILGATIVAPHAGEMINEISLAMKQGIGLAKIGSTIHPYPTQAEAIRKLGDQYQRTRLTPTTKSLLRSWLSLFG
ncbi:mercuric reductase [bacterium]|nr:mercuric reductase [bacterium]